MKANILTKTLDGINNLIENYRKVSTETFLNKVFETKNKDYLGIARIYELNVQEWDKNLSDHSAIEIIENANNNKYCKKEFDAIHSVYENILLYKNVISLYKSFYESLNLPIDDKGNLDINQVKTLPLHEVNDLHRNVVDSKLKFQEFLREKKDSHKEKGIIFPSKLKPSSNDKELSIEKGLNFNAIGKEIDAVAVQLKQIINTMNREAEEKVEEIRESKRKANEAKKQADEEAKRKETIRKAAEEAKRKATEATIKKMIEEIAQKAAEEAKRKAAEEAKRKAAAEEESKKLAEEAKLKAEEKAKIEKIVHEKQQAEKNKQVVATLNADGTNLTIEFSSLDIAKTQTDQNKNILHTFDVKLPESINITCNKDPETTIGIVKISKKNDEKKNDQKFNKDDIVAIANYYDGTFTINASRNIELENALIARKITNFLNGKINFLKLASLGSKKESTLLKDTTRIKELVEGKQDAPNQSILGFLEGLETKRKLDILNFVFEHTLKRPEKDQLHFKSSLSLFFNHDISDDKKIDIRAAKMAYLNIVSDCLLDKIKASEVQGLTDKAKQALVENLIDKKSNLITHVKSDMKSIKLVNYNWGFRLGSTATKKSIDELIRIFEDAQETSVIQKPSIPKQRNGQS